MMKRHYRLLVPSAVLAALLALPLASFAKGEDHGNGRGHSEGRGGHSESHGNSGGGSSRSSGDHGSAHRWESSDGGGGGWRSSGGERSSSGEWRGSSSDGGSRQWRGSDSGESRGSRDGSREWRGNTTNQVLRNLGRGGDTWRSGRTYDRSYGGRSYTRYGGGGGRYLPFNSRTYYRYDGPRYSPYRYRSVYYVGGFYRPRFIESSFSIGFVIASYPYYGYQYYDPYCDEVFDSLGDYYDHCDQFGHPDAMVVLDVRSGYPVATCGYHRGYWVVDDCY